MQKGVLQGGSDGVRSLVKNEKVFGSLPSDISKSLRELINCPSVQMYSGEMQTTIFYKGFKVGGYNRKHRGGHGYLSSGVVIDLVFEQRLEKWGFEKQAKMQKGTKHEHVWWELPSSRFKNFSAAVKGAMQIIDAAISGQAGH